MHELIREDRNAITIYIGFRPTPDLFLTAFFSPSGGSEQFSKFSVEDLLVEAREQTDADAQAELWKQANTEILQNYAAFAVMYINLVYARRATVDYGHELVANLSFYPGIDETTTIADE